MAPLINDTLNQPLFGANATHQPSGLMVPATILQAFGSTQLTQRLHFAPSFGLV